RPVPGDPRVPTHGERLPPEAAAPDPRPRRLPPLLARGQGDPFGGGAALPPPVEARLPEHGPRAPDGGGRHPYGLSGADGHRPRPLPAGPARPAPGDQQRRRGFRLPRHPPELPGRHPPSLAPPLPHRRPDPLRRL